MNGHSRKLEEIDGSDKSDVKVTISGIERGFRSSGKAPKERSGQAASLGLMRFDAKSVNVDRSDNEFESAKTAGKVVSGLASFAEPFDSSVHP